MDVDKIGQNGVDAYVQKAQAASIKTQGQSAKEASKAKQDEVAISDAAKEMQRAQQAVLAAPDVREDKVAAIKKQIQEGTYHVPAEAVVEKLLSGAKGI